MPTGISRFLLKAYNKSSQIEFINQIGQPVKEKKSNPLNLNMLKNNETNSENRLHALPCQQQFGLIGTQIHHRLQR